MDANTDQKTISVDVDQSVDSKANLFVDAEIF